tara:strand:- start:136 stop:726 length:591 start_codon:yes stop_codon:yes gene_type:complete
MIKIGILGDIGSGKSFVAKQFGYPVFNADDEVNKIYKKDKKCFIKIKNTIPKHITTFPINKTEIVKSIVSDRKNLKKITKIIHPIIRSKMNIFINKNKKKKLIVLDVPLLLENKLNKKDFILVFVDAEKKKIIKNLKKRKNYDSKIFKILKKFQLPVYIKKQKSDFIIKNNFKIETIKKNVRLLKNFFLTYERSNT